MTSLSVETQIDQEGVESSNAVGSQRRDTVAPWRQGRLAMHLESKGLLWSALLIQALLSLSLSNTIFNDEATYVIIGRAEISHILHGTPIPDYSRFVSGAANIYPILAAAINYIGGIHLLRLASLAFMLLTTALVYAFTERIFGWGAATLGAGSFAVAGPILFMGVLATHDAMTMFLISLAIWVGVRGSAYLGRRQLLWQVASGAIGALAILTTYSGLMFIPSVALTSLLYYLFTHNLRQAIVRIFAPFVLGFSIVALEAWRHMPGLVAGIFATTVTPFHDSASAIQILGDTLQYEGLWFLLGACGIVFIMRYRRSGPRVLLGAALLGSGLLSPLWHMHLGTAVSLQKHDGYGLLFVTPLVGIALSGGVEVWRRRMVAPLVGIMVILASLGNNVSTALYAAWPNSTSLIHLLRSHVTSGSAKFLVEEGAVPQYYFSNTTSPDQWISTYGYTIPRPGTSPLSGLAAFEAGIRDSNFALIALSNGPTKTLDLQLEGLLAKDPSYETVAMLHYATSFGPGTWRVWQLKTTARTQMTRLGMREYRSHVD